MATKKEKKVIAQILEDNIVTVEEQAILLDIADVKVEVKPEPVVVPVPVASQLRTRQGEVIHKRRNG